MLQQHYYSVNENKAKMQNQYLDKTKWTHNSASCKTICSSSYMRRLFSGWRYQSLTIYTISPILAPRCVDTKQLKSTQTQWVYMYMWTWFWDQICARPIKGCPTEVHGAVKVISSKVIYLKASFCTTWPIACHRPLIKTSEKKDKRALNSYGNTNSILKVYNRVFPKHPSSFWLSVC